MLRQSLRPARLLGTRSWSVSTPATRMSLGRQNSHRIMSNGLCRLYSASEATRESHSPENHLTRSDGISSIIRQDHREIERYYSKIVDSNDPDTQRRYQNAFVWELTRHSIAEELVVYPSLETGVNDGKVMADKDRSEHQVVRTV